MPPTAGKVDLPGLHAALTTLLGGVGGVVRTLGFWTAIVLPLVYLPLMVVSHPWVVDYANFVKLVGVHVASVLIGQRSQTAGPEG